MSNVYTVLQLRGGTREEHLAGNGIGFVGEQKEVTVDTTDYRLRVHDGVTIGGHPTLIEGDKFKASDIIFSDGETLQEKYDSGKLGGDGTPPNPPTNSKPTVLAVDVRNKLPNGSATISYYVSYKAGETLKHEISIDNGRTFKVINPTGDNPFESVIDKLTMGQNICAVKVSIGDISDTEYFIVDIPPTDIDTPPSIDTVTVKTINLDSFTFNYTVSDNENDDINRHQLSIDNGFTYRDIYPVFLENKYEASVYGLTPGTTYYCRLKVGSKNMESTTYGFNVVTNTTRENNATL